MIDKKSEVLKIEKKIIDECSTSELIELLDRVEKNNKTVEAIPVNPQKPLLDGERNNRVTAAVVEKTLQKPLREKGEKNTKKIKPAQVTMKPRLRETIKPPHPFGNHNIRLDKTYLNQFDITIHPFRAEIGVEDGGNNISSDSVLNLITQDYNTIYKKSLALYEKSLIELDKNYPQKYSREEVMAYPEYVCDTEKKLHAFQNASTFDFFIDSNILNKEKSTCCYVARPLTRLVAA